jgi:hypothetical protein
MSYTDNVIKWINDVSKASLKSKSPFEYSKDLSNELMILYNQNTIIKQKSIEFYNNREKFNKTINPNIVKFIKSVKAMFNPLKYDITYKPMSSYPKLNLPNDSDFDLGVLVKDFNTEKMFHLNKILCANGYTFEKVTKNKGNPGGEAYRYGIMYEGIECEVKIRNLDKCKALVALHDKLNSLKKSEAIFWTYNKYLVKEWSKKNDKYTYELFKMILFHTYFNGVKGAFILIPGL